VPSRGLLRAENNIEGPLLGAMLDWLIAVVCTAVLVEAGRRIALAIGLVDRPTERKSHEGEIPLVGGVAIFLGLVVTLGFLRVLHVHWAFLIAGLLLVLVGIWDDLRGIRPLVRIFIQGACVLFVTLAGDAVLLDLGNILPGNEAISLGWMAIPFTVFAGIGLINAFNMSDGVDGVCGTLALVALIGLGTIAARAGQQSELMLTIVLGGCLVGFLAFNVRVPGRQQAMAFLGDAGSYLIGLSILYLTVRLSQGPARAMPPVAGLWICMLPLFDTIGMIIRRLKRGQSPFSADREHIHHVFLLAKFTVPETWAGLTIAALLGMTVGVAGTLNNVPEPLMMAAFIAASLFYYWQIMRVWKFLRFLSRSINRRAEARRDRRSGKDRRRRSEPVYVDGVLVEQRSGADRRNLDDDRRRTDAVAAESGKIPTEKPILDAPGCQPAHKDAH
jgi:UDP-GlcNAc:undecaprenyl-phosphate/decaprenyl-phosphate GlcNAc-1-phosphate transferase